MQRLATPLSALAIAGASFALAACGSSDSGSSSTTATNASGAQGGARNADFQKFQQCLKDNGVTLPNRGNGGGNGYGPPPGAGAGSSTAPPSDGSSTAPPSGGAGGGGFFGGQSSDPKTQKAMKACAKYRPQGGPGANGQRNGNRAQLSIKAYTPYLTCLKDQGLDVKVADGFNALRNLKQSDPKVQAAFKACQSKLPQRPSGAGGSSAAPSNTTTNGTT
jgi:hypothetical protein